MPLRIDRAGFTTVQDLGRPGWAHVGVPGSGAVDRSSHRLANRLVGNPPRSATLETSGGLVLAALDDAVVALAGAECEASVDGRPVPHCAPAALRAGSVLRVDRLTNGARTYVAVAGGIVGEELLGSLSQDTLSGIVPVPLRPGATLSIGVPNGSPVGLDVPIVPQSGRSFRVESGPHSELFPPDVLRRFLRTTRTVSAASDRVGVRLLGGSVLADANAGLESVPLVRGAIQATPGDELVVMLADHPTTGGYPVIAVMHPVDVDHLAQCGPGAVVSLVRP